MSVYCICGSILILKTDYCTREIAKLSLGGIFVVPSTFKQNQFSQKCQRVREISIFEKIFIIFSSEDVWKTVAKPNVVNTAEGEDVTVEVQIAGGNPEKLPEVKFVKGKWNELNGPNYVIDANTEASFQIIKVLQPLCKLLE